MIRVPNVYVSEDVARGYLIVDRGELDGGYILGVAVEGDEPVL
jgi:hypothetical protein